jgi:hypothetical protein
MARAGTFGYPWTSQRHMLYFRINVSPAAGVQAAPPDAVAHVLIDAKCIHSAATEVVKRLHADRWKIVDVLTARTLQPDERFRGNAPLAQALREAEEYGYSFYVETPIIAKDVFQYSTDTDLAFPDGGAEGTLQAG